MTWNKAITASVIALLGFLVWWATIGLQRFRPPKAISQSFLPGHLSQAHEFLKDQCASCHTPTKGVATVGCVSCHADNKNLLQRQSTAFHANVTSCKECHREHQAGVRPPLFMDHEALAKIGGHAAGKKDGPVTNLSCVTCHATRDRHQGLFGNSCVSCHTTTTWRIAEYKHPSPNNRECAQCHQAPPSHYMMHFEMVSMTVAGQHHAKVNQCFLCHQSTSWNDIKGVGWYKHH